MLSPAALEALAAARHDDPFGVLGMHECDGALVVRAVLRRDYPVIQGALLVIAGVYVIINFTIDVLYVFVDPRVRHG